MSRKLKCSKAVFYSNFVNLTYKVRNYCVITIFVTLYFLNTPVMAQDPFDCPGSAPSGTFTVTPYVAVSGWTVIGRNVYVTITGNASDPDEHWDWVTLSYTTQPDTFLAMNAYKWVITDLAYDANPKNLTGNPVYFTTMNYTSSCNGSISMYVKDDGYHYQDLGDNTLVSCNYNLWIDDPTGIRLDAAAYQITYEDAYEIDYTTELLWQLTYGGQNFPWVGSGVAEFIKNGAGFEFKEHVSGSPIPQTPGGTESKWDTFTPDSAGWFYDYHDVYFEKPYPPSGTYDVWYNSQRFQYVVPGGSYSFGNTYMDYEYVDSTGYFIHTEFVP